MLVTTGFKANDVAGAAKNFFDGGINSAILRYLGAPDREPTRNQTEPGHMLLETELHVRAIHCFSFILTDLIAASYQSRCSKFCFLASHYHM